MSQVRLSASRIKTAQECSWKYWAEYHLKLRGGGNSGSGRGNCCHPVLEALLRPDRKPYYEEILKNQDVYSVPAIKRMIHILAKKNEVFDEENLALVNDFLLRGLSLDFYCEGALSVQSEFAFEEKNEKLWTLGYIDKIATYIDKVLIIDYKTQKNFFTQEELEFNIQAMLYVMVARKMFPDKKVEFEFHQLKEGVENEGRGKNKITTILNPVQKVPPISDTTLEGFKEWLYEYSKYLENFDINTAKSNFASKDFLLKRMRCGGELGQRRKSDGQLMFCCDKKYPFLYFALMENGVLLETSKDREVLEKKAKTGQEIIQKSYSGCPSFSYLWE